MEDGIEAIQLSCASTPSLNLQESNSAKSPDFPLTLLQTQPKCEVYPDLHRIIQVLCEIFR